MTISFAPLEGITGWVYRTAHHAMFPGADAYYTPFLAPTTDSPLTARGRADAAPEHNVGIPLIPQILTNKAENFITTARALQEMGWQEVNLNLGCPSGTVVSKRKGSGFLSQPQQLDEFLDAIFSRLDLRISVKTRIGVESPDEWPALLEIYSRYPIAQLIVHPRIRRDFYRAPVRMEAFQYAVDHTSLPLCYNGDLNTPADCQKLLAAFPSTEHLMLGRGLVGNPALVRQLRGGPAITKEELLVFHDRLVEEYRAVLSGDHQVLGKMKELWFYMSGLFTNPEKYLKSMRKARSMDAYASAVAALFRDQELIPHEPFHLD